VADLVTHLATAFFWKAASRRPHLTSFVLGVALPDLVGRAPVSALQSLHRHGVTAPIVWWRASPFCTCPWALCR
jgi:hypothetical protein